MTNETTIFQEIDAAMSAYHDGLRQGLINAGFEDVTLSEAALLALVGDTPKSMVQIASLRGVSKQAVQSQIQGLAKRGFAVLKPDPSDARIRLVSLSARGFEVTTTLKAARSDVDQVLEAKLGAGRLNNFRNMLGQVVSALN